jgi:uncharacterized RDD family membrane protein YckC
MDELQPTPTQRPSALCAEHPERPAAIICARCGGYACDLCQRVGNDRRDYCVRCVPALEQLADPGTRLIAMLVDRFTSLLPLPVTLVLVSLLSAAGAEEKPAHVVTLLVLVGVLGSLGMLCYQLYLLLTTGQSLGKRMVGIKVVRTDGSPIDVTRLIFLRNLLPAFVNLPTCGLFSLVNALIILTAERRCLHDHIADTKVIRVDEHTR